MVMYANEFKTKENQKLTEIKNELQHFHLFLLKASKFAQHFDQIFLKSP